jgi:hypothetical protein
MQALADAATKTGYSVVVKSAPKNTPQGCVADFRAAHVRPNPPMTPPLRQLPSQVARKALPDLPQACPGAPTTAMLPRTVCQWRHAAFRQPVAATAVQLDKAPPESTTGWESRRSSLPGVTLPSPEAATAPVRCSRVYRDGARATTGLIRCLEKTVCCDG